MLERSEYTIRYTVRKVCQSIIYRLQILTISNTAILKLLKLEKRPSAAIACFKGEDRIDRYLNAPGITNPGSLDRNDRRLRML